MKTITFGRGDVIFRENDKADCMYDIISGSVRIISGYNTEHEHQIAVLGSDQVLGEMGMIELYPRSATAVALDDGTTLVEITEIELSDYFRDKPEKLLSIMKQLSHRIRETDEKYINACRVIYENQEAETRGKPKTDRLLDQTRFFASEYMHF